MPDYKELPLNDDDFIRVYSNGSIVYRKDKRLKTARVVIETRQRGNSLYYYERCWVKGKLYYVHRLVATAWVDNPDYHNVVIHKDGNTVNNAPSNLEWVYSSQAARVQQTKYPPTQPVPFYQQND